MTVPESDVLAARYGRTRANRTRDRVLLIAGAAFAAIVLVAWVVWAGLDGQKPQVEVTDTGHRLINDERAVEVSWNLSVPPGNDTACIVQALNEDFTVVGWKVIDVPASTQHIRSLTETVRVAQEANTGLIYRCWLT
ncbi:DUF4307 domain-containing protein [Agromyces sp. SYSU K20354]|uniref:DUF4307 domain-containing protein n=1 Tax=Agromyces cavernae TaxID=2898659 RepID=UPI001E2A9947|nr:DUF4307 domain-containing protein [Agromyces cavernae]MCD2442751.1 DUF4307 domain-containing protein [Agromyces cavernae]